MIHISSFISHHSSLPRKQRFTLIELLVVIAIIAVLSTMLFPTVSYIRSRADKTKCSGSMRELYVAVNMYWGENHQQYPSWLSNMYPYNVEEKELYQCPSDGSGPNGTHRSINRPIGSNDFEQASSTFDRPGTAVAAGYNQPNGDVPNVSYIYEFCGGLWPSGWSDRTSSGETVTAGDGSWQEMKIRILKASPVYAARMPIIRCFWHAENDTLEPVLNISSTGNIFTSKSDWQDSL